MEKETQNLIFEELTDMYGYWGENNLLEMIDFCNRNQLYTQRKALTMLLN